MAVCNQKPELPKMKVMEISEKITDLNPQKP